MPTYLEIRAVETEEVVTIIEVLSPKNNQLGIGRLQYETKRLNILGSATNFVEIDGTNTNFLNFRSRRPYRLKTPDYPLLHIFPFPSA